MAIGAISKRLFKGCLRHGGRVDTQESLEASPMVSQHRWVVIVSLCSCPSSLVCLCYHLHQIDLEETLCSPGSAVWLHSSNMTSCVTSSNSVSMLHSHALHLAHHSSERRKVRVQKAIEKSHSALSAFLSFSSLALCCIRPHLTTRGSSILHRECVVYMHTIFNINLRSSVPALLSYSIFEDLLNEGRPCLSKVNERA